MGDIEILFGLSRSEFCNIFTLKEVWYLKLSANRQQKLKLTVFETQVNFNVLKCGRDVESGGGEFCCFVSGACSARLVINFVFSTWRCLLLLLLLHPPCTLLNAIFHLMFGFRTPDRARLSHPQASRLCTALPALQCLHVSEYLGGDRYHHVGCHHLPVGF